VRTALVALVLVKLGLHAVAAAAYGYFRDELYYLASTEHLDWGYVEHPPLSIALLAAWRAIFGDSLHALRALPALAGAAQMLLTAAFTRRLGGGPFAAILAATCVLAAPVYLGTQHVYSMNAFDQLFWIMIAFLLDRALERPTTRRWIALGIVLGLALLNKLSVVWILAGLGAGLLFTPHRRVLGTRGPWIVAGIGVACILPHVIWQMRTGWPLFEFMQNAARNKMVRANPIAFLGNQVLEMLPFTAPIWIAGLVACLRRPEWRHWGIAYLLVLAILLARGTSRASYLVPAYPMLLAPGAIVVARFVRWRPLRVGMIVVILAGMFALMPFALPLWPPETFARYAKTLGIEPQTEERAAVGILPQHYADQFGWKELAETVARVYHALPPEERASCVIFGQNYGEAGAIDVLGRKLGLPPAISSHNSYWLWGPGDKPPDVVIVIGGDRDDNAEVFESLEEAAVHECHYCRPFESGLTIYVGRKMRLPISELWPQLKRYI